MARIVLTTFGSYGDLFPYVALGQRLRSRGHAAVIAAAEHYRGLVEASGLPFRAVRPDVDFGDDQTFRDAMDPRRGTEFVVRRLIVPHLSESLADLDAVCEDADLLVSHALTYAAPIVGERRGLPWVSTMLSPMMFCSAYDPPALPGATWLASLRPLGPRAVGALWRLMRQVSRSWGEPIRALRRELGLPADRDPLWEGQVSPHGSLALFSAAFARAQPDWPARTTICGFPFHDADFGGGGEASRLKRFLDAGPPPLAFSLGSSAVRVAGAFYELAVAATERMGRRAVLVLGDAPAPASLPGEVLAVRSVPVHELFPAAAAVVHAGGIGSTGHALRAGRPQLVVPFAHDQFDNARRVERQRFGLTLGLRRLTPTRFARRLEAMLASDEIVRAVEAAAVQVRAEDGTGTACEALEGVLGVAAPPHANATP